MCRQKGGIMPVAYARNCCNEFFLLSESPLTGSKAAQLFSERFTVGAAAMECARRSIEHGDGSCASASGDPGGEQTRKSERK
jgi:hypothetical protein